MTVEAVLRSVSASVRGKIKAQIIVMISSPIVATQPVERSPSLEVKRRPEKPTIDVRFEIMMEGS